MAETKERKEIQDPLFSDPTFKKALALTLLDCPSYYKTFVLYLGGLEHTKIAGRQNLSVNTVKKHIIGAKRLFLQHLEDLQGEKFVIFGKYIRRVDLLNAVGKFPACDD